MDLVLVDGPNLFNTIGRHLKAADEAETYATASEEDSLTNYFLKWFDVDRVVSQTLKDAESITLGTVIFHSSKPLGGAAYRIKQEELSAFWGRQAAMPATSAMLVDIPGEQQERHVFECEKCKAPNKGKSESEKGVDSSMIVYMFESARVWNSLCIFSRDVDFVPAVWALRRQGKQVFAAGRPEDAVSALGRAAQNFYRLPLVGAVNDLAAFRCLRKGGVLDTIIERVGATERCWPQVVFDDGGLAICVPEDMAPALENARAAAKLSAAMRIEPVSLWQNKKTASFKIRQSLSSQRPSLRLRPEPLWMHLVEPTFQSVWKTTKRRADEQQEGS